MSYVYICSCIECNTGNHLSVPVEQHRLMFWDIYSCLDVVNTYISYVYFQLDLVCEDSVLQSVAKMMFFGGVMVGSFVFGLLSDRSLKACNLFLARMFQRKSWAFVIARASSLSSSCKNFNVAHYSKNIEGINIKLGIFAHHDKVQLQNKGTKLWKLLFF